jgi:cell division protein FtsI/penicillin-binding protein 2
MSKGFSSSYRTALLAGILLACFGALAVRLVWLHAINRDDLLATITRTRQQLIAETARRGDILDRRGVPLATSRSVIELGVDPNYLRPQDEAKWPRLAELIGMPEPELRRIFTTKFRAPAATPAAAKAAAADPLAIRLDLGAAAGTAAAAPTPAPEDGGDDDTPDVRVSEKEPRRIQWARLRDEVSEELYAEIRRLGIQGITGDRIYRRTYPGNQLAAHVVGFVNKAQQPAAGVEAVFDFFLRGQDGWRVGEKDGRNRELAQFRTREAPRVNGYHVGLSIDLVVQDIIEQELLYIADKFQPLKASIVVSDPRTGFILGMGNYPSFNLNEYNKVPQAELARLKNAAVADVYEPGSVFKIVAAAGAIEDRLVTPNHVFDCALERIANRGVMVKLPSEDHRMGDLTVSEIISHSSNKGAAQLALKLGEPRFFDYVRKFGFGRPLGFPVGAEVGGILTDYRKWYPIDITRIAMGHSVASTVLQMHQAMSVIANDGVLLRPQLVTQITDAAGEPVHRFGPEEIHRVVSKETAQKVARMLMGVASVGGTAAEAAIPGFDVAGKTGTTQKLVEETRADGSTRLVYSNKHHVGSFVGFFPAGRPQVVISVIVDQAKVQTPSGVAYGRLVAAPSFKRIGERLIPILDLKSDNPPVRPRLYAAVPPGGAR